MNVTLTEKEYNDLVNKANTPYPIREEKNEKKIKELEEKLDDCSIAKALYGSIALMELVIFIIVMILM